MLKDRGRRRNSYRKYRGECKYARASSSPLIPLDEHLFVLLATSATDLHGLHLIQVHPVLVHLLVLVHQLHVKQLLNGLCLQDYPVLAGRRAERSVTVDLVVVVRGHLNRIGQVNW